MESRQRLLVFVFGAMVLVAVGDRLWQTGYVEPLLAAQNRASKLRKDLTEVRRQIKKAEKDQQRLQQLTERSLPADVEAARTLYQEWLTDVAERIELRSLRVDSNAPRANPGFRTIPFSLRGAGSLEQITSLLFEFYRAPMIHHLESLSIVPVANSRDLNLNLAIEAVIVDGVKREDALPQGQSELLANDQNESYRAIARRNIFSASGGVEAAGYMALTAIVAVDGYPQAWFTDLLAGDVVKVGVGESFRAGALECRVAEITLRDLIFEVEGQRWLMTVDDRLVDAVALPPEQ
ncbi:MAG: hypothetical protein KDA61_08740 [Planctomycetales bacterium]|nr:hypothetical protein [Planctomycetales bacterium]